MYRKITFVLAVLCFLAVFMLAGLEFHTTTIEQVKDFNYLGKTVIVEGYAFRDPILVLVTDPKWIAINCPMPEDEYVFLTGETKFLPHRGMGTNHVRVKGIVVTIDPKEIYQDMTGLYYYPVFAIDVMRYELALSEKKYKR